MTPPKPVPGSFGYKVAVALGRLNVGLYKLTKGKVGGRLAGAPVCILRHTGAKSGTVRDTPLLYLEEGEAVVLVASMGGSPKHPAWYHNLRAHPDVEIQRGSAWAPVTARVASATERERLWPKLTAMYSDYDVYQSRSDGRVIPVVMCEPRSP